MNRRELFRVLPFSLLGLPSLAKGQPEKVFEEPSPWAEMMCQNEGMFKWREVSRGEYEKGEMTSLPCQTKFKFLRIAVTPICPKCGWAQDMSKDPELRAKISGIEVIR